MLKVMTVVGTRPEIIRLSRVIDKLDRYCTHVLVHTGQNYDYTLNDVFFSDLAIRRPDIFLEAAGETAAATIAQVMTGIDRAITEHRPDAFLVLGDTNSCLAAVIAKRRHVPVFHMEAGNRSFDFRVPEEINRRIVDHVADINLPYSDIARGYLLREGLAPDQIITTGSPMREILEHYRPGIDASDVVTRLGLTPGEYFIVSAHREENVDEPARLERFFDVLQALGEEFGQPILVSTHPRTRKRIGGLNRTAHPLVRFENPFGFFDYVKLQIEARAVLSDSGSITEEASVLNLRAVNLREAHERPEGFEEGAVMFTGFDAAKVLDALRVLDDQPRGANRLLRMPTDYEPTNVSDKVLRIILSYTDFVNHRVWRRE